MKFILLSAVGVLLLAGWSLAQEDGGGVGSVQEASLGPDLGASDEGSRTAKEMETFAFPNIYNGAMFYAKYKGAMFLQNQLNIVNILSGSRLLHARMETMTPGQALLIEGMAINLDTPLIIKKNGLIEESDVDVNDFTVSRLLGLTATYLYENRGKFPALYESLKTEVLRLIENNAKNPNTDAIKTFMFSKTKKRFEYKEFYNKYKEATFLQNKQNVDNILNKVNELRHQVDALAAGEALQIGGMFLEPNSSTPLVVHKSYRLDESDVDGSDFTLRRLSGLTAVYVSFNLGKFPDLRLCASEPEALGIDWKRYPNLYLSAVSGAELFRVYFANDFLICALRRYQLKQISEEQLMQVVMTRYSDGFTSAEWYKNYKTIVDNNVPAEFKWDKLVNALPEHIKRHFTD